MRRRKRNSADADVDKVTEDESNVNITCKDGLEFNEMSNITMRMKEFPFEDKEPDSQTIKGQKVNGSRNSAPEQAVLKGTQCKVTSKPFIMYYLILMFLLSFATPVLITTSLNVFIYSAVKDTTYEVTFDLWSLLFPVSNDL